MPRRLTAPEPALSDDVILLEPLARRHVPEFDWAVDGDPDIVRFTRVPTSPAPTFLEDWLGNYEDAWLDGTKAGFAIRAGEEAAVIGFAGIVELHLDARQGGNRLRTAAGGPRARRGEPSGFTAHALGTR